MIELPNDIDREILELVAAMNRIPGIETRLSCCGHGKYPIWVWFVTDSIDSLSDLLFWFHELDGGFHGWTIIAEREAGTRGVTFRAEGPVGAYDEAKELAAVLNSDPSDLYGPEAYENAEDEFRPVQLGRQEEDAV